MRQYGVKARKNEALPRLTAVQESDDTCQYVVKEETTHLARLMPAAPLIPKLRQLHRPRQHKYHTASNKQQQATGEDLRTCVFPPIGMASLDPSKMAAKEMTKKSRQRQRRHDKQHGIEENRYQ